MCPHKLRSHGGGGGGEINGMERGEGGAHTWRRFAAAFWVLKFTRISPGERNASGGRGEEENRKGGSGGGGGTHVE